MHTGVCVRVCNRMVMLELLRHDGRPNVFETTVKIYKNSEYRGQGFAVR